MAVPSSQNTNLLTYLPSSQNKEPWFGHIDMTSARSLVAQYCDTGTLKPVLNWANVSSPEHTLDSSTNYDLFFNWTFSSLKMVQTVRQTLLRSQLTCNEMQVSARTCGRQHDRKCRLKSSQYTLIIPHRVIQLTTISFWVPETRLCLPQVNKLKRFLRSKWRT